MYLTSSGEEVGRSEARKRIKVAILAVAGIADACMQRDRGMRARFG
jgi:hypothetical protein